MSSIIDEGSGIVMTNSPGIILSECKVSPLIDQQWDGQLDEPSALCITTGHYETYHDLPPHLTEKLKKFADVDMKILKN